MMNHSYSKIFLASMLGTALEWYDFSLFAYLTPTLANLFFPKESESAGLLLTYGIFAMGFIVRPIGAMLFGHLGDRQGRKVSLLWTILLMSIPTSLIGLLPTYATFGLLAPFLLLLLRICQGLSVGGESTGAVLFALESDPRIRYHGFWSALLWSTSGIGMLLGSVSANWAIHSAYSSAWRIPFLFGIITGIVGYFLRKKTNESLLFEKILEERKTSHLPLLQGIKHHSASLLIIIAWYILSAMITYLIFIYMQNYVMSVTTLPKSAISTITTIGLLIVTLILPLGGLLSDKIGTKYSLLFSSLAFTVLSYPLFCWVSKNSMMDFIFVECIFVIFAAIYQGTITHAAFQLIPIEVRYSLLAVGYNISYAFFGGTAPFIATYLVKITGNPAAPGMYLAFGGGVALFAVLIQKHIRK